MTQAIAKTSTVVVTAPHRLSKEQRTTITGEVQAQLPPGVGVIVVDPGFTVATMSAPPILVDLVSPDLAGPDVAAKILVEIRALRNDLAKCADAGRAAAMRVQP